MTEQTTLWEEQTEEPDVCCGKCRLCAALAEPYERSDGSVIYGYCFKLGDKTYSTGMGKGFPIFLPLSCGATCESFHRRPQEVRL